MYTIARSKIKEVLLPVVEVTEESILKKHEIIITHQKKMKGFRIKCSCGWNDYNTFFKYDYYAEQAGQDHLWELLEIDPFPIEEEGNVSVYSKN